MAPDTRILLVAYQAPLAVNFSRQAVGSPAPCLVVSPGRFLLVTRIAGILLMAERALVPLFVKKSLVCRMTVQPFPCLVMVGRLDACPCFFVTNAAAVRLPDIFLMAFQTHGLFVGKKEVGKALGLCHFAVTGSTVFLGLNVLRVVKYHVRKVAGLQADGFSNWLLVAHVAGFIFFLAVVCLIVALHAGFLAGHTGNSRISRPFMAVKARGRFHVQGVGKLEPAVPLYFYSCFFLEQI
jgi:hypothetical protein